MTELKPIIDGITDPNLTDAVKNAPLNNFFMYAFIIFSIIMVIGFVAIIIMYTKRDSLSEQKHNEQYKNLIDSQTIQYKNLMDGYMRMMEQNSVTNSEFRKTIDNVGEVLRQLSQTIAKSESKQDSDKDKLDLVLTRLETMKESFSRSIGSVHTAFREHDQGGTNNQIQIQKSIEAFSIEVRALKEWCQTYLGKSSTS